ncbi:LysR substrate-binding domain-containing protein, partial [Pseudonocardia pini]|uniref:LysR substrate-binding domain-containing protein n=1 Tax=Pseudonocardia pini TaxID=2758030 RepID=UPI0015EFF108
RSEVLTAITGLSPEQAVRFVPDSTQPLVDQVADGLLDVALVHGPVKARGLRTRTLETHPVAVVVARGRGFDDRTSVRLEELADLPFASVYFGSAPLIYERLNDLMNRMGVRKRLTLGGSDFGGLAHLVASGQAFALAPLSGGTSTKIFVDEPVVRLALRDVTLTLSTMAVWSEQRRETDETVRALVDALHGIEPIEAAQATPL